MAEALTNLLEDLTSSYPDGSPVIVPLQCTLAHG